MIVDEEFLQYIDYTVHERLIDVTSSREFWHSQLKGYNLEGSLSLPVDQHRSSTDQRSGSASLAEISFDNDISRRFLNYASSHQVTPFQLGLATFYAFLFKLTHGENDLCISCLNANRYRTELQNMIGMFVAILPYRLQLDPYWSFDELVKHVREKCLSILEHSHYPLQHILADSHGSQSNVAFLETAFDFITISSNIDQISFDGATLEQVSLRQSSEVAKFDFMLRFVYNSILDDGRLACHFVCSRDLFEETTVTTIARRFQHLFCQIFSSTSNAAHIDHSITPVRKLSLILPVEAEEMQRVVFRRLPKIDNQGMHMSCIVSSELMLICN
jgi:non-ribosomal peptide synthetase component F